MSRELFRQRLRASTLSMWELGDLLGIHPHHLHGNDTHATLADQPVRVIIELARHLDMHPADLIPALDAVLANRREQRSDSTDKGQASDSLTVLTALSRALDPLSVDQMATALGWSLERTTAAVQHAMTHPELGGPLAVRRVPPQAFTVTTRLDILTAAQQQALAETGHYRDTFTVEQATVLLAAIAYRSQPAYADFRREHLDGEHDVKAAGLLRSDYNPGRVEVSPEVYYSLRYWDRPEEH